MMSTIIGRHFSLTKVLIYKGDVSLSDASPDTVETLNKHLGGTESKGKAKIISLQIEWIIVSRFLVVLICISIV